MRRKIISIILIFTSLSLISQENEIFKVVKENNIIRLKPMLEENPDLINEKDGYGRTPLHWAARGVYIDIMKELIAKGANVNLKDNNGVTPVISVVARNNIKALNVLIENNATISEPDIEGDYPIHIAASYGHVDMVKFLIDKNDSYLELRNSYDRTPLVLACRESGDIETVEYLINRGANINTVDKNGGSALSLSAWRGFAKITNLLLLNNANVDISGTKGSKLLKYACSKNLYKLYSAIIEKGGNIDSLGVAGQHAMHWAAMGGSYLIMKSLIDKEININRPDIYGWTPLHYASYFGRDSTASLLIEQNAIIDLKTPLNETALFLAQKKSNKKVISILKSHGAREVESINTGLYGKYFGQKNPNNNPAIFAPGIVSRLKGGHSNITFSRDGEMAFWTEWNLTEKGYSDGSKILFSRLSENGWTYPEVIITKGDCPVFSADDSKLYFFSSELIPEKYNNRKRGIWYFNLNDTTFSNPFYVDFDVDKYGLYWQFSFDSAGNLYYGGLHGLSRALFENNQFKEPEKLSKIFHPDYNGGSPYIAPTCEYIIFNSGDLPDSFGAADLYIGFKKEDGSWTKPINMGNEINTVQSEILARCSLDGKFLFYISNFGNIKWISTDIIEKLKRQLK